MVDFTGRVIGAINVSAPISRVGDDATKLGRFIARVGAELSSALGAPAGDDGGALGPA